MHETLEVLRQEHRNVVSLINTLAWQVAEFERGRALDYDVISATLEYFLNFPDLYHHPKEDLIFAKLRERDPAVAASVGDMHREHQELAARAREFSAALDALLDEVQTVVGRNVESMPTLHAVVDELDIPRKTFIKSAHRFLDLQRQHLEMEEARFFAAADKTLTVEDWADLQTSMTRGEDPLFGKNVAANFDRLRRAILAWQAQDEVMDVGL